jgi:hypothetical protein
MLPDLTAQTTNIPPFQGVLRGTGLAVPLDKRTREAAENAKKERARQACSARGCNAVASGWSR